MEKNDRQDEVGNRRSDGRCGLPGIGPVRPMNPQGKRIMVTGGSSGIGLALAHAFANAGVSAIVRIGMASFRLASPIGA